jgi:hypothetical protein
MLVWFSAAVKLDEVTEGLDETAVDPPPPPQAAKILRKLIELIFYGSVFCYQQKGCF